MVMQRAVFTGAVFTGLALSALLITPAFAAQPIEAINDPNNRIITQARANLTPAGAAWAKEEAQRVLSGQVQPFDVAKDAAHVENGLLTGGSPDDLVLIALIEAQNANGQTVGALPQSPKPPAAGERATRSATLEQSIANVIHTLSDTQHVGPTEKQSGTP